MSRIEEIMDEWKLDTSVNKLKLDEELIKVPQIHSKYLAYFVEFKSKRAKALNELNAMKNIKRRYYRGEFTKDDLYNYGWNQWQGLKPGSAELNQLFEQDADLNELEVKLELYNTVLASIEYIMKSINSRGYELRTLLDYIKFMEGN